EPYLRVPEVAKPAVHELRRAARRARREVLPFDEEGAQAEPRRLREDSRARDSPADDDEVPLALREPTPDFVTPTLCPHASSDPSAFLTRFDAEEHKSSPGDP